jgi:hypothetical protein
VLVLGTLGVVVLAFASIVGCSSQGPAELSGNSETANDASPDGPHPVAVVDETEAWLGILDPNDEAEKCFEIRNQGEAPLVLRRGGTSCKCTMSDLPERPIMPGEAAVIRVSTKSEEKEGRFDHTAAVLTNDPANKRITFCVSGKFQKLIAFDPPGLIATSLERNQKSTLRTVAYSQVFRDFELESVTSTLEGLTWEIESADERTLEELEARSGYRITLTLPATATTGDFWKSLAIKVRSNDDPPRIREARCKIAGSVVPRADMAGEKYSAGRILNVGSLRRWQGATERLTLTVRDDHRNLEVKSIEKTPDFLEVEVSPIVPDRPDSGLYWVNVTIPRDAPPSNYVGSRKGEVRIVTDHPEVPVMRFWVQFAVTSI